MSWLEEHPAQDQNGVITVNMYKSRVGDVFKTALAEVINRNRGWIRRATRRHRKANSTGKYL
jgi:hypothetical protein